MTKSKIEQGLPKTKGGLPWQAFAIVGDKEEPETWKLPHHTKAIFRAIKGKIGHYKTTDWEHTAAAVAALSRGEVQAVIADHLLVADYLRAHPEAKLRLAGQPFAGEPVALAVRKDNAALLDQINAALDRLRQKGLLAQIERRWSTAP